MMRRFSISLLFGMAPIFAAPQEGPKPFKPLDLGPLHGEQPAASATVLKDPALMYASRHEAAVAALKAANIAAAAHANDRAISLLLLAAKRDPQYALALYDLGVLCERSGRWQDAANFFRLVAPLDASPEIKQSATAELARVQLVASLENSAAGKRQLEFDIALVKALSMRTDPAVAADAAARLAVRDPARWEAPALLGVLNADLDRWAESATVLNNAASLAPFERRPQLIQARDVARRQAQYKARLSEGDQAWEKKEYGKAAKLYAEAWAMNPAANAVGMQAATGYLLEDQVVLAIECLIRLRQTGSQEEAQTATAMLEKLGAISDSARQAALNNQAASQRVPVENPMSVIARSLADITSPEMLLVSKAAPDMIQDPTRFIPLDDTELTSSENAALLSTESVFARYQKFVAIPVPLPLDGGPAGRPSLAPDGANTAAGSNVLSPAESHPAPTHKLLPNRPILPNLEPHC